MKKRLVFVLAVVITMCLGGCGKEAASIGIIGGADGPTAIFLTSEINWLSVCGLVGVVVVAVLAALVINRNKKK